MRIRDWSSDVCSSDLGDLGARDGLRRDPRLRDQRGSPVLAGGLLPAGRPCRSWHVARRRGVAAGDRGPRHLEILRLARVPVRAARAPGAGGALTRLPPAGPARAGAVRRPWTAPGPDYLEECGLCT